MPNLGGGESLANYTKSGPPLHAYGFQLYDNVYYIRYMTMNGK